MHTIDEAKASAPPTPSNVSFQMREYVNVTPTPSPSAAPAEPATPTGLREDVGRKIFEEHSQKEDANKHVDATTEAQLGAKDAETDMKDEPAAGGLDAAPEAIKNTV